MPFRKNSTTFGKMCGLQREIATHPVGLQLAVDAAGAPVARTAQSVLGDRETDPASHRSRRGVRRHGAEDRPQFRIGIRHGALLRRTTVVRKLQEQFPTYADNFPIWSEHTSAMHQLAVWTMLEDAGFGASLQHYNPLIDKEVREQWDLPAAWRLIAQMPFGTPGGEPQEKSFKPWEERIRIFK